MPNAASTARWANSLRLAPLTAAIGLALSSAPAQAGSVITVTTNASGSVAGECTLRDAVLAANNDSATAACAAGSGADAIEFDPGVTGVITLQSSALSIAESLTITGPTSASLAIDGNDSYRILEAAAGADVTVSNLTLRNGRSTSGGAAFQGTFSILELNNCVIRDNVVESTGSTGAVSMQGGNVTIADTLFENNVIEGAILYRNDAVTGPGPGLSYGAALSLLDSAITITGSNFNGNQTGGFGGAIAIRGSNLIPNISDSTFSGNTAAYGGAIAVLDQAQLTASNVTLSGNEAGSGGGAFVSGMSEATFSNATVENNNATTDGGGLMVGFGSSSPRAEGDAPAGTPYTLGPGTLNLNDSVVSGNFAGQRGGGVLAIYNSYVDATNSTFEGNSANVSVTPAFSPSSETRLRNRLRGAPGDAGFGGGLLVADGTYAYLTDMDFIDNAAIQGGGVMAIDRSTTASYDGYFAGNTAQFGGAMQAGLLPSTARADRDASARGTTSITVCANCTITDNSANFGGAMAAFNGGVAFTIESQVTGNQATGGAAGIAYEGLAGVKYSTVSNNTATDVGGALYGLYAGTSVRSIASTLSGNQAAYGGAIANYGGSVKVYDSLIVGNQASNSGGAMLSNSGTDGETYLVNSTIAGNSAPLFGGILASGLDANFITISGNQSTSTRGQTARGSTNNAGGLYIDVTGDVILSNSIIANNTSPGGALDLVIDGAPVPRGRGGGGGSVSMDYTLVEAPGPGTPTGAGNLLGIDPQLLALADNGGPTQTMSLAAASPAVDAGNPAPPDPPEFDQRGEPFPRIAGGRADMGALELIIDQLFSDRFEP